MANEGKNKDSWGPLHPAKSLLVAQNPTTAPGSPELFLPRDQSSEACPAVASSSAGFEARTLSAFAFLQRHALSQRGLVIEEGLAADRRLGVGGTLSFPPEVLFRPPVHGALQACAVTSHCLSFLLDFQKEIQIFLHLLCLFSRQYGQQLIPRSRLGGSLSGVCTCLYSVY